MMRRPPYAHRVEPGAVRPGHKLLVFAGPKAWDAARWYLGRDADGEHRAAHVLVLPPDATARAASFAWPVRRRPVVVVSTCENDAVLVPLFGALQRDGAWSVELYAADASIGAVELEWQLLCVHWGHPFTDPAPRMREAAAA